MSPLKGYYFARVLCEEAVLVSGELKFYDTWGTDKGEGSLLCTN